MELLERQTELDQLHRWWQKASAGRGKLALIAGEAGVGKSALVEAFIERQSCETQVLWGNCDALQTPRPLGPVYEIAAMLPLRRAEERNADLPREALFGGVLGELAHRRTASIVVLEDLHWGDQATLDFVRYLGRRIGRIHCLFIVTYRDDELPATHALRCAVGELTGDHTRRIKLPPLSPDAVATLADASGRDAFRLYEVTAGNPFFVRELLSAADDIVPQTVRDAVIARLMRCSPQARSVAELVSVIPGRTEHWLIKAVLGHPATAVDEVVAGGLLSAQGTALAFRHELGRLAVESCLSPGRARGLHRKVLRALIESGDDAVADPAAIVHHAVRAEAAETLLAYAPRAGREAARLGAHREAAAHFGAVLRCCRDQPPADRAELFELHAQECNLTNQVTAALASADQALALWKAEGNVLGQARALRMLSRQYWLRGEKVRADQTVSEAITLLEKLPPGPDLGMAYSAQSQLAMLGGRVDEALASGTRALELARTFGDGEIASHALNNVGAARLGSGDESGYADLERSLTLALEHDLTEHAARAYVNLTTCSVLRHDLTRAERYLRGGISYCEEREIHTHLAYLRAYAARFELERGNWADAAWTAEDLLRIPGRTAAVQRIPTLVVLALVRIRRGDPGADELLDEAWRLAEPTGELQRIGRVKAAQAEHAWYQGDLQRVAQEAEQGLAHAVGHRDPWIKGELVWWQSRAKTVDPVPEDIAAAYGLMVSGSEPAKAARLWQDLGLPYERTLALSGGGREALLEALPLADALGAAPLGRMIRRRLREAGVRGVRRGPRPSTLANPAGLTGRELQVLELLAQGHSNAELAGQLHLSERTIHRHVTGILGKLGARSRAEATAAAFRLGIVSGKR